MVTKGIIHNLPNEEYHHGKPWSDYLSSSQLKLYLKSPRHARYMMEHPQEQTEAMRFGSLFHSAMQSMCDHGSIEPFLDSVAVFTPPVNEKTGQPYGTATIAYRNHLGFFTAQNEGKTIVSREDVELIEDMVNSIVHCCGTTSEQVCKLLKWTKETEASYFLETDDGIKLKVRPDALTSDKIIDWKTCNLDNLNEENIARQIITYRYDISLSMYQWVLRQITGKWYRPYLVFVSKVKPHECVICDISSWCYFFSDDEEPIAGMGVGAQEFQRLLKLHTECDRNNEWPGIESTIKTDNKIMELQVPWWYEKKFIEE